MLEAMIAERKTAEQRASTAGPLAAHGEIGNGRSRGVDNTSTRGSTNADYLAARIKRDHPEIHNRMKAGEYLARCMGAVSLPSGVRTHEDAPAEARAPTLSRHR